MLPRDIGSQIKPVVGIVSQSTAAAAVNGAAIDRTGLSGAGNGYFLSATLHAQTGAATGTPTTTAVTYKIQDSVDTTSGDFADSVDAQGNALAMTALAASTDGRLDFDLSGLKRYIRVVATAAFTGGSSPAVQIAASVILGGVYEKPTNYV